MCKEQTIDNGIDLIFDTIDGMFKIRDFDTCDYLLQTLDPRSMQTVIILSYMTITLPAKSKLPNRQSFYFKAQEVIIDRRGRDTTKKLLEGLK